jgi:DNA modification methylase
MSSTKLSWRTEQRKVSDLIPHAKNPRTLSKKQRQDLEASITTFGLAEIPAINTDNTVLAGHARLKILKALGRGKKEIDVRVPNRTLTDKEAEEYMLRSNRNTGSWDYDLLKNFDTQFLIDLGFEQAELTEVWGLVEETADDDFDEKEAVKKARTTKIKLNELYQLGDHRLFCGNSAKDENVYDLLGGEPVDVLYSDSPYNIALDYNKGIGGKKNYGGKTNDRKTEEDFYRFTLATLMSGAGMCKDNAHIFWYCDQRYVGLIQRAFAELEIDYKRTALWIKNGLNPTPGVAFSKCYEPCVYGTIGKPYLSNKHTKFHEILNKEVGNGNATIEDVADLIDLWIVKRLPGDQYEHPTQKPVTLHERPLLRTTKVGDRVLDLFGGSGSTLIACEQLKRRAFLMEIEPVFCQVIIDRWEKFTGKKAVKIS